MKIILTLSLVIFPLLLPATSTQAEDNILHVCVNKWTGIMRMVSTATCKAGERYVAMQPYGAGGEIADGSVTLDKLANDVYQSLNRVVT